MVYFSVGAGIVSARHHVYHGIVAIVSKGGVYTYVMAAGGHALRDFLFFHACQLCQFLHARPALVFLFKAIDFLVHFVE